MRSSGSTVRNRIGPERCSTNSDTRATCNVGGGPYIQTCIQACVTPAAAEQYARAVTTTAQLRGAQQAVARAAQRLATVAPEDLSAALYEAMSDLEQATGGGHDLAGMIRGPDDVELDVFLHAAPADHDWCVPGLIERGDRVILTGPEGGGKSTLQRQLGVQVASGIHPFDPEIQFEPVRVCLLDLENSARQVARALRPLRLAAGDRSSGGMIIAVRPEGLDLTTGDGAWLDRLVADTRPDLLIAGPLYKLAAGDPTEEEPAKIVAGWLDKIRATYGCAVLLEAHSPHATGRGRRPERPYGASLWLRWPEFGLHLSTDGDLRHWRGPRDERDWPAKLQRGGTWPWTPVTRERNVLWARIKALCIEAGDQLSYRDLAQATGVHHSTVSRSIEEHPDEWATLKAVS
jgi:hypothetical protein